MKRSIYAEITTTKKQKNMIAENIPIRPNIIKNINSITGDKAAL